MNKKTLRELFNYKDGALFWAKRRANIKAGARAGCMGGDGCRLIRVLGRLYLEHRLIFLYHNGYLPEFLDHIDRDRMNNNIENLRPATKGLNKHNCDAYGEVKHRGVSKHQGKFTANICKDGKSKYLGIFATASEASAVYEKAAAELYG